MQSFLSDQWTSLSMAQNHKFHWCCNPNSASTYSASCANHPVQFIILGAHGPKEGACWFLSLCFRLFVRTELWHILLHFSESIHLFEIHETRLVLQYCLHVTVITNWIHLNLKETIIWHSLICCNYEYPLYKYQYWRTILLNWWRSVICSKFHNKIIWWDRKDMKNRLCSQQLCSLADYYTAGLTPTHPCNFM